MHLVRFGLHLFVLSLAVFVVACSQGASLPSPTSPSAMPSSSALVAEGTADESFSSLDRDRGRHEHADDEEDHDGDDADRGELSGLVTSVGTNSIVVRGITVKIQSSTRIRHGHRTLTLADIQAGDHVQVRGTRDGAAIVASEIKVEDREDADDDDAEEDDDDGVKVEGTISALSGTCPSLKFTVNTVKVTTSSATRFDDVSCTALANGNKVEVKGAKQADGSIAARKIELD